jgi:hypothetical protein
MSEHEMQQLESQFPAASGVAFAAACQRVLASGQSVLQSKDGVIYERFPDGRRVAVKTIEAPTLVKPGSILTLR